MTNCQKTKCIFAVGCLLKPSLQAGTVKEAAWTELIANICLKGNVEIISLPCPETLFTSKYTGLGRKPHGITFYERLDGFQESCDRLSEETVELICQTAINKDVIAIVGVEHSPTCAVSYLYTNKGMVKRKGLFFERIEELLKLRGHNIPFVGINRNHPRKAIEQLSRMLQHSGE